LLYLPVSVSNGVSLKILRQIASRATEPMAGVQVRRCDAGGVPVVLYEPPGRDDASAVLVWLHGGGRVSGDPVTDHRLCSHLASEAGVLVVSAEYRLAPEHPFPAALDDTMTVLRWVHESAAALGVDPARIAVGGPSAGGGLAAETAQRAHDEGVPVAFQLLVYPMLDDRTVAVDDQGRGRLVWTATSNRYGWSAYLEHPAGQTESRPYAVAARREDLAGLAPAWIGVGDLDLFFNEDVDYAQRLQAAGVAVQLDIVPGMYHGADVFLPRQPASMQSFWQRMADALAKGVVPGPVR
jgi:acetyl esterase/lipase